MQCHSLKCTLNDSSVREAFFSALKFLLQCYYCHIKKQELNYIIINMVKELNMEIKKHQIKLRNLPSSKCLNFTVLLYICVYISRAGSPNKLDLLDETNNLEFFLDNRGCNSRYASNIP